MSLDIWSRDDIAHILAAVSLASQAASGESEDYRRGHASALLAVSVAFGCGRVIGGAGERVIIGEHKASVRRAICEPEVYTPRGRGR